MFDLERSVTQRLAARGHLVDCGGNGQAGSRGAFRIGLTHFGPSEVDQDAIGRALAVIPRGDRRIGPSYVR
jgi:hypothetical protein